MSMKRTGRVPSMPRCCSFRWCGAGAVSPTRGRIEVVLAVTRTCQAANLGSRLPVGFQAKQRRTCPGSRLSLQYPRRTGGSWLASLPPHPRRSLPCHARGGKRHRRGEGRKSWGWKTKARLRGLRFDWVGECSSFSNRSFPDWSRSCRAGFLNLPFRAPSRPPRLVLVLVFSPSTRYTKTRPLHILRPSRPLTQRPSDRRTPRDPSARERPGRHSLPLPCAVSSPVLSRLPTPDSQAVCALCCCCNTSTCCGFPGSEPARFFRFPSQTCHERRPHRRGFDSSNLNRRPCPQLMEHRDGSANVLRPLSAW